MIVCLGWGSLVWDHRDLPTAGEWRNDGPTLPLEFARQSRDGRITLVVADDAGSVPVCWTQLDVRSLDEARIVLARREGIQSASMGVSVGFWCETSRSSHCDAESIGAWAESIGAGAVVWTALQPRFGGKTVKPTCDQVVAYLSGLTGETQRRAEEYVRRAPAQIKTRYRNAIEQGLGWTAQERESFS
jgi:hypothetical protein